MKRFIFNAEYSTNPIYPIMFHTACDFYMQETLRKRTLTFHQILLILDGKGTLSCNEKKYALKKGCAFFTASGTSVEYTNEEGLISAFITVRGVAADELAVNFSDNGLLFTENTEVEKYTSLIKRFIDDYKNGCDQGKLSAQAYSFFVDFISHRKTDTPDWLSQAVKYITLHFAEKINLSDIARHTYVSVSKLCHEFKKHYSTSVFEYIMDVRLQHAQVLLHDSSNIMTKEVAELCGFYSVGYFCKAYRKKYGKTPSQEKSAL